VLNRSFPLVLVVLAFWVGRETVASDPEKPKIGRFARVEVDQLIVNGYVLVAGEKGRTQGLSTLIGAGEMIVKKQTMNGNEIAGYEVVRLRPGLIDIGDELRNHVTIRPGDITRRNPDATISEYVSKVVEAKKRGK